VLICASELDVELHEPLVFRTVKADIYQSSIGGSVWLRSDQYYRNLEDQIRNDPLEGVNSGTTAMPVSVRVGGVHVRIQGDGGIGQQLPPHYLMSLHGTSISATQRHNFGGHTFGIRSLSRLSVDVLYQASRQVRCLGYRFGQVSYQHSVLCLSLFSNGAAINLGGDPPVTIGPLNTDILRKRPMSPFIEQDEWRIAIFTDGYLGNDATAPLKVTVDPSYFYPYTTFP
jgi:hypothetical protein